VETVSMSLLYQPTWTTLSLRCCLELPENHQQNVAYYCYF